MAAKKKNKTYSCSHCEKEFLSPHKKKFCSSKCRGDAAKNKPHSLNQFIIDKFLGEEIWKDKILVFREMKFSKDLIKKYPLKAFWQAVPLKFDMESLSWLISPQGKAYLKIEYAKFSLDLKAPKKYDLSDTKHGEEKVLVKNIRTVKDFIKYGCKKENK